MTTGAAPTPPASAIIEAAATVLREHGSTAVTTRRVADAAGVKLPTIYRLFGDKGGLLDAVAEHVYADYVAAKSREVVEEVDLDPVEAFRRGWRNHIEFGLTNPGLFAIMHDPDRSRRSPTTAAGITALRTRIHRIAVAGRLAVEEERAVALVQSAGAGVVLVLLAMAADVRDAGLADAMFDCLADALFTDPAPAQPNRELAAAVTLAALAPTLPGLTDGERALLSEWLGRSIAAQS